MNRTAAFAALAAVSIGLVACDNPGRQPQQPQQPGKTSAAPGTPATPPSAAVTPKSSPQQQLNADIELSSKVKEALKEPARGHVEVAAADGVVTLYGTVDGPADKERIALMAMNVDGVRSVVNNLVVVRGS